MEAEADTITIPLCTLYTQYCTSTSLISMNRTMYREAPRPLTSLHHHQYLSIVVHYMIMSSVSTDQGPRTETFQIFNEVILR